MSNQTTSLSCRSCHAALQPDERFCPSCGAASSLPAHDELSPWTQVIEQLQHATLGEFEVSRELGRGGMAAVYLAHEIALNRLVAIKVMAPGLFLGPGMVDRFRQEAVTVANLSHPNIITIHGVRQIEDLHFLVMKFIEGRSLEAVLQSSGPLAPEVVRAIMFQVGSGLAYAHRRGVIHRDVKPANILLDADGNAIVTDFGIAKLAEQKGHTQTGTMVGTPAYMSPEQCYGGALTWSSDLYSMGIVCYELLTGAVPFTGTAFSVMQAHTATPPPPIRDRRPDCPPDLEAAVLQLLGKTPEQRFASMAEALHALGAAPLGAGDPVRITLERLAVPDAATREASVIRPAVSPVPRAGPRVGQLVLTGLPDIVAAGDRFELRGTVRSDAGATLSGRVVSWSSSDDTVAAVTASGTVIARAPGRVNITASCEGVLASLPITVLPAGTGKRQRSRSLLAAGLGAALLLAVGGYALMHRSGNKPAAPAAANPPPGRTDTGGNAVMPPAAAVPQPPPPPATTRDERVHQKTPPAVNETTTHPTKRADSTSIVAAPPAAITPPPLIVVQPPPPPPPPAAAPIVAGPTPAEIIRSANATVQLYVEALRARSVPQMRKVFPNLPRALASDWENEFAMVGRDVDALDISAGTIATTPASNGESAVSQFTLTLLLHLRKGGTRTASIACRAVLRRDGTAWLIEALDQAPAR